MTAEWCTICGERITEQDKKNGNYAEMYNPKRFDFSRPARRGLHPEHEHGIVHAECGLQAGWEQA